jgi:DNA invertase Pin-like site-specific DNA recombinase
MTKSQAYSYLRVSGKSQVDGDGFPRQRDTINRYAKAHGIEIAHEYCDEGVSGTTELADRKGLAALLDAVGANGVKLVLVERADRLARDLMVGEIILKDFREAGAVVITADSGVDLTANDGDPTRILIRQVLAAVAQFDKSVTVLKLRAARDRIRRQKGRCEGRKPFGTRPGEQATLERMRALRRKPKGENRMGYHRIAHTLNAESLPSRSSKPWSAMSVSRILSRKDVS